MNRSMLRSSIKSKFDYRSMLVGYQATLPLSPTMFLPGEGYSTAVNKMLFSTETMSLSAATLTFSTFSLTGFANGTEAGYALISGAANKYSLQTDTNYLLSYAPPQPAGTYRGGHIPNSAGYYVTNTTTIYTNGLLNKWEYATDTVTTSTPLSSFGANIGPFNNYTLSNNPSIYFGGGTPAGNYFYGGLVKLNTSTNTASAVWADATATSRAYTSGAENGSTAGYIGGGVMMPATTYPTNILKITYASDTTYSTLSATLSSARSPARVGVQSGVCAYYAGGKTSGSSVAVSLTSIEKLTYSTETRSAISATVDRDGYTTWNTQ